MAIEALATPQSYEIVSVLRAKPMPDPEGSTWYNYVISYEGKDSIHGCRQGDLEAVTVAIEEIVTLLNERHLGHFRKLGRAHVALTPKKKNLVL
ncbi:MAG: hypothetical protein WBN88_01920 [Anderseniella sp.]